MTILAKVKIRFHGRSWAPLSRKQYDGRNGNGYQPRRESGPPCRTGGTVDAVFDLLMRLGGVIFSVVALLHFSFDAATVAVIFIAIAVIQDEVRGLRTDLKRRQDRDA